MKAHFIYSGLLVALITIGCGSEPTEPTQQTNAQAAKPQVEPAAAPKPSTPVPAVSAPAVVAPAPENPTPRADIFRSAGAGDIDTVKYHLANGIKLNARDKTGKPLCCGRYATRSTRWSITCSIEAPTQTWPTTTS